MVGLVSHLLNAAFLIGIGLLAYGSWLAWHPLGFIVLGVLLIMLPILYVRGTWDS